MNEKSVKSQQQQPQWVSLIEWNIRMCVDGVFHSEHELRKSQQLSK
jgi:hypothetical protein